MATLGWILLIIGTVFCAGLGVYPWPTKSDKE